MYVGVQPTIMYRARDRVDNEEWLSRIERAADSLDLGSEARSYAEDLFLSRVPEKDRSKPAVAAASLYAGGLLAGEERSQTAVAEAMDVARLSIQTRWKDVLRDAGFRPPSW
jgi:transcription initiation factor TFIIIB Brf1 subunit/transcription initiation factor TFIIB